MTFFGYCAYNPILITLKVHYFLNHWLIEIGVHLLKNIVNWLKFIFFVMINRRKFSLTPLKIYPLLEVYSMRENITIEKLMQISKVARRFRKLIDNPIRVKLIRVGRKQDGGYLIPKLHYSAGISIGIGQEISFETSPQLKDTSIAMFDHTINFDNVIKNKPLNLKFFQLGLGDKNSSQIKTLSEIKRLSGLDFKNLVFIKIDIEGNELQSLQNCDLNEFAAIIIELHWLENIFYSDKLQKFEHILNILTDKHQIVNAHVNNFGKLFNVGNIILPDVIELSLIRTNLVASISINEKSFFKNRQKNSPCRLDFPEIWPFQ